MRAKLLCSGNDGSRSYEAGDEYEGDGDWIRRLLVNDLATPLDAAALAIVESPEQQERHHSATLKASAAQLRL